MALILDGVDGKVARRTGTSTALGARFDMEVDAFLILVLSVYVLDVAGPLGAADRRHALRLRRRRPGAAVAERAAPAEHGPQDGGRAPGRRAAGGGLGPAAARGDVGVVALALGSLVWSFGRDIAWLFRNREGRTAPTATATANETVTMAVVTPAERRTAELVRS